MSKNSLRSSIAASMLVAFAGVAHAQQERGGPAAGGGAEPPASRGQGAQNRGDAQKPSPNASERATGQAPGVRGQAESQRGTGGSDRAQERTGAGAGDQPSKSGKSAQEGRGDGDADRQRGGDKRNGQRTDGADGQPKGDRASEGGKARTEGRIQVAPEQRTRIQQRIRDVNVRTIPRDRINVEIRVGSRLPRTIDLVPIPNEIVEIVPQFRGYRIIRVGSEILIVEPGTFEIIYVLSL